MKHWTHTGPDGRAVIEAAGLCAAGGGWAGPAADRLAAFEALGEELAAQQEALSARMAALRSQGRERTVQFRETLLHLFNVHPVLGRHPGRQIPAMKGQVHSRGIVACRSGQGTQHSYDN